jgi:poly(A) polymerase
VLRLLRYYRFEARFGGGDGDPAARAACGAAAHLLPTLSGERLAQELIKLLDAADPIAALRMMQADGVLAVALPEARRIDRLQRLIAIEPAPDALRRLAALVAIDAEGGAALASRLRFSNAWRDRLVGLASPWPLDPAGDPRSQHRALYDFGAARYRDLALLLAADGAITDARLAELSALARGWIPPAFPLGGRDVTALGIPAGARVGRLLAAVRRWWEDGDFAADRSQCLDRLRAIARNSREEP